MLKSSQKPRLHALVGPLPDTLGHSISAISQSGILAVGNHEYISIIDLPTMELIQTLHHPSASMSRSHHVQLICWSRENYHHDLMSPYMLRLASASAAGLITVWDAAKANILCDFRLGSSNHPVLDMHWLEKQDSSHDLLLALHNQSDLVLWNADTGTQLWKKTYLDSLFKFSIDPFDSKNLVFLGSNCILLVNDFSLCQMPVSGGRKFYVCGSDSNTLSSMNRSTSDNLILRSTQLLFQSTMKLVKGGGGGAAGDKNSDSNGRSFGDIVDVLFHKSLRSHLVMVYSREIMLVDTLLSQTVAVIAIDNNSSPFVQVHSCSQGDYLYCLHANGCITMRGRQPQVKSSTEEGISPAVATAATPDCFEMNQMNYKLLAQSDPLRMNKNIRMSGMCVHPRSELEVTLLTSDGKVQLWSLQSALLRKFPRTTTTSTATGPDGVGVGEESLVSKTGTFVPSVKYNSHSLHGNHSNTLLTRLADIVAPFEFIHDPPPPSLAGATASEEGKEEAAVAVLPVVLMEGQFHFTLTGYTGGLMTEIAFARMCLVPKKSNALTYQPLLALASKRGHMQIWHLGFGKVLHEMQVMPSLHGMQWLSDTSLIMFTHTSVPMSRSTSAHFTSSHNAASLQRSPTSQIHAAAATVRNDMCVVDLKTHTLTNVRNNHPTPEAPIVDVRVSCFKQYMAVLFEERSVEIWDAKTLTLLFDLSHSSSKIALFEWTNLRGQSVTMSPGSESRGVTKVIAYHQENIVLVDRDRYIYLYQVEGPKVVEKSKIPIGNGMNRLTALTWKDDYVALGDCDGNILFWNLKGKLSQNYSTSYGMVRKMKFAPGKGHKRLLVLQFEALEIWDVNDFSQRIHMRLSRDMSPLIDVEWVDSAHVATVTADCIMRVLSSESLAEFCSPIPMENIQEALIQPALLPPKVHFLIQLILQHQPDRESYEVTCPTLANGFDRVAVQIRAFFKSMRNDGLDKLFYGEDITTRCLLAALIFGNEYEIRFWSVVRHFIQFNAHSTSHLHSCDYSLGLEYDCLTHSTLFRAHQSLRVAQLEAKKTTTEQNRRCVEALIMLGKREHAIKELINSSPDQPTYITDVYKACLLSSLVDSEVQTPVVSAVPSNSYKALKTAAVNFISNGELSEGVQLLCSIGLYTEACHYLMSYQKWDMALWLAKCAMDPQERANVLQKWAQHLRTPQINEKTLSLLVLVVLGKHKEVLENLYSLRHFNMATRYLEACEAHKLLPEEELDSLKEAIYLEFARQLMSLGNRSCALYYCQQAGVKGQQLMKEVDFLIGD